MIRQLCPNCAAAVELPAAAAGTTAPCPKCGVAFAVPATYTPSVAAPAAPEPPPGFVPPKPAAGPVAPPAPTPIPAWLGWVPAAALTVALLASLFPWAGSYPGGVRVFSQTAWQAAVGSFSTALLPDDLIGDEGPLRAAVGFSGWLVPYLPLLLIAVAAAWAERLVPAAALAKLPPRLTWLAALPPHRYALLAGLAAGTLLLLVLQNVTGFGLERAAVAAAEAKYADEYKAAADAPSKQTRARVKAGFEANRLGVQTTTAEDLAMLAHLVAALAAGGGWWLHRRGDKPLPRLAFIKS